MTSRYNGPLTTNQRVLYNALKTGGWFTNDELVDILYSGVKDGGPRTAKTCVEVNLYAIRKKLGVKIENRYTYRLAP